MVQVVYPSSRADRILTQQERAMIREFLRSVSRSRVSLDIDEIERLVNENNIPEIVRRIEGIGAAVAGSAATALTVSAEDVADFLTRETGITITYDRANPRAVELLRDSRRRIIGNINGNARQVIENELVVGVLDGRNPRETARAIQNTIGLNPHLQGAVNRYRRLLTEGEDGRPAAASLNNLRRLIHPDNPTPRSPQEVRLIQSTIQEIERARLPSSNALSDQQVTKLVNRYRTRLIRYRAERIARTETLRALNEGSEEMFAQGIQHGGLIEEDEVVRTWVTAGDGRVRDSHSYMHRQQRGFGQPFTSGDGNSLRWPGDGGPAESVNCRCTISTIIEVTPVNLPRTQLQ